MPSHTKPEYNRKYYLENKEKVKANVKRWQTLNKDKVNEASRKSKLKTRYGMNSEDYDFLYEKQKGYCAICETHQSDLKRSLCIDHNHETGKVRGLLCDDCNRGLGCFDDNVAMINSAIDYLRNEEND